MKQLCLLIHIMGQLSLLPSGIIHNYLCSRGGLRSKRRLRSDNEDRLVDSKTGLVQSGSRNTVVVEQRPSAPSPRQH